MPERRMVSNTAVQENCAETTARLPPGKYRIVAFDLDLTGRRLIDEICHIAAYTPNSQFKQYVMPFKDLNTASTYRHLLKIVTVGKYRMLKCVKTGELLKTKSEISAMSDFLQWLENLKADGIILVTHDSSKTVPPFLLEVLGKYKLLDRFTAVVKGFANSCTFAEQKCERTVKSYALYMLSKVLLGKSEEIHSAADRARLSYQIVQHLCAGEDDKASGDATSTPEIDSPAMSEALRQIATTVEDEQKELALLKELVERQNSLRPIFGAKMTSSYRPERNRATDLRRLLAKANLTYETLLEAWKKDKKQSLLPLIKERISTSGNQEDIEDVIDLLLAHFDPEYTQKGSLRRGRRPQKSQPDVVPEAEKEGKGEESQSTGDTESKGSSGASSPGKEESDTSSPLKSAAEKIDEDTSR